MHELKGRAFSGGWGRFGGSIATLVLVLPLAFWAAHGGEAVRERGVGGVSALGGGVYRNSWAVVIGINEYTKAPQLNYAVNDARSMVAAVQKLGFQSDKILLLLNQEATKQRIEQILYGTLRRTTAQDRVLVFFAGHGMTSSLPRGGEEGFILPVDGDPDDLPLTAIAMADVRQIARRIPAKHILFAVDACYSGFAISREVAPAQVDTAYLEVVTKHPAVQIITAGRKDQPVVEEEGHGIFTRRLLSGLTGPADTDGNGIITAQELGTWLTERVVQDSGNRQHPQYSRLDGEGQFVFVVPGRERPPLLAGLGDRDALQAELKRVANEAERLKRENALLEQARKLFEQRQKIDLAKLDAERALLKAQAEKLGSKNASKEKGVSQAVDKPSEEEAKIEMARLETEERRLVAEEELFRKQKAEAEKDRMEAERKQREEQIRPSQVQTPPVRKDPPKPIPKVVQPPQYRVGDSWTVRFRDGRTETRNVRAIERDMYVFEWGLDLWQYRDSNLVLRKQVTPLDGQDVFNVLVGKPFLDFPLSVGKSWSFRISSGRAWRTISFWVQEIETVETPAGTFEAFKIFEESRGGGPITLRYWWYAPEVKFPVALFQFGGQELPWQQPEFELVAYELK